MWVFLHGPQQTTDLKFVDQLKIKSSDHMTLFHVTWSTCLQSFFVARAESYFPPRDWLKTKQGDTYREHFLQSHQWTLLECVLENVSERERERVKAE